MLFADNAEGIEIAVRTATFTTFVLHLAVIIQLIQHTISYYHVSLVVHYAMLSLIPIAFALRFRTPSAKLIRRLIFINILALATEIIYLTARKSNADDIETQCVANNGLTPHIRRDTFLFCPDKTSALGCQSFFLWSIILEYIAWSLYTTMKDGPKVIADWQPHSERKSSSTVTMIYFLVMIALSHQQTASHFQHYITTNNESNWGFGQIVAAAIMIIPAYELYQNTFSRRRYSRQTLWSQTFRTPHYRNAELLGQIKWTYVAFAIITSLMFLDNSFGDTMMIIFFASTTLSFPDSIYDCRIFQS